MSERLTALKALQQRVREAKGPNSELDVAIEEALRPNDIPFAPEYTSSLDACLSLMREVLPGWQIEQISWESEPTGLCVASIGNFGEGEGYLCGCTETPTTPPLAVIDAILAAKIAEEEAREVVA